MKSFFPDNLKLIQNVINRLANNCFLIKGWAITISLAGLGLYLNSKGMKIFLILMLSSIIIFWILDAYYLRIEKLFRELYKDRIEKNNGSYSLDVNLYLKKIDSTLCLMLSFPTCLIYLALILMVMAVLYYG